MVEDLQLVFPKTINVPSVFVWMASYVVPCSGHDKCDHSKFQRNNNSIVTSPNFREDKQVTFQSVLRDESLVGNGFSDLIMRHRNAFVFNPSSF